MFFTHLFILAVIQGITEFLPVSSSGHLVLAHEFMGSGEWTNAQEKMLDIAMHIGTLLAVFAYFYKDLIMLIKGGIALLLTRKVDTDEERLVRNVIVASLPIIPVGLGISMIDISILDSIEIVGWTTIIFGLLLGWADKKPAVNQAENLTWQQALLVGCMQILSLIPGTSRSGITMTTGRFLGLERVQAARFSLLMAMITISAAGAVGGLEIIKENDPEFTKSAILAGIIAAITGYAVIWGMMKFLKKGTFLPFVIYRVLLGVALLTYVYFFKAV